MAVKPQKSLKFPGGAYPVGRTPHFHTKYLRKVGREGVLVHLPPYAGSLLMTVVLEEDHRRYAGPATFFNEDLARATGCSPATMRRTREALVEAGLLHYERVADKEVGLYWVKEHISWEPLERFVDANRSSYPRQIEPANAPATEPVTAPASAHPNSPIEDYNPSPNPLPVAWGSVVEGLRKLDVRNPTGAADAARRNGFTPELAQACLEFLQSHRSDLGPGAVVMRFRNPEAHRWPANQNWPPVSSQAQLLQSRKFEAEQAARARSAADAKAAQTADRRKREQQLLLDWGDQIDRLPPQARIELLGHNPLLVQLLTRSRQQWRENPMVRFALCEAMAARHASN